MNPWVAKVMILAGSIALVVIPHRLHGKPGRAHKAVRSRKGPLEIVLLALVTIGLLLPLLWVATPALAFADYPLHPAAFAAGAACLAVGLWLLHRSHADLGTNWSITLELWGDHQLVTRGVYHRVRHPMYGALLIYGVGQALVLPNWLAGPSYGVAVAVLLAFRISPEERMLLDEFGVAYESYRARTYRLVPGVW